MERHVRRIDFDAYPTMLHLPGGLDLLGAAFLSATVLPLQSEAVREGHELAEGFERLERAKGIEPSTFSLGS